MSNIRYYNTENWSTMDRNTGNCNTGNWNTGNRNTGNCNTGDRNTGDCNTGNQNTGYRNTGYRNTGDRNTGDHNTGDRNTGDWNAGNWNTGDGNTGNCNTGDRNTGDWNTGDCNTGNWNTGDRNTGYCNTITPTKCYIFNKLADRKSWFKAKVPEWMHVSLTVWVYDDDMTDKEKEAYPSYITTGGYLKVYSSLKQAYIEAWEKTTQEDRELTLRLPNYDPVVATEIFGFNPSECVEQKKEVVETQALEIIELNGKKYQLVG